MGSSSMTWMHGVWMCGMHTPMIGSKRYMQTVAMPSAPDSEEAMTEFAKALLTAEEGRLALTPQAIVDKLDKHIVGQADAKRAVAIALRNRWRRARLPKVAAEEVMPKNILMIGPTGCGKTEIARRLAKLADAPFIKVEATKYTELGYVGRDVDDIVKDLVEAAIGLVKSRLRERVAAATAEKAEAVILAGLVGEHAGREILDTFRELYRSGALDERQVEVEVPPGEGKGKGLGGLDGGVMSLESMMRSLNGGQAKGKGAERRKMRVAEARQRLEEAEAERVMSSEAVTREAIRTAEQDGIVFIDEIDKIVNSRNSPWRTGDPSSQGVQRDLLPIIEGSAVQTKHGTVNTDHILFICSGAFHSAKPSDMLAELQGRLPIRVELRGLTRDDFHRILTEPQANLIKQQQALMETEGVELKFTESAIAAIAEVAEAANRMLDNIGARRLHTVIERVLADISFNAPEKAEEARRAGNPMYTYVVDEAHVRKVMTDLLQKQDLSRYVL